MKDQLRELISYLRKNEVGCLKRIDLGAYDSQARGEVIGQMWAYGDAADRLEAIVE